MKIIACLGNPGRKYKKTRHNIGFIIGDYLADSYRIKIKQKSFSSIYGTGKLNNEDICIIFPKTYMNSSGTSVQQILHYFKEKPENLIVVHDEIELPFGEFKTKLGGGHKGHNGLRSIVQQIGSPDFHRVRLGVGRPDNPHITVADYVLSNFTKEEIAKLNELAPEILDIIVSLING